MFRFDLGGDTVTRKPKAGWHSNPANPGRERYWDGDKWTDQSRDAPPPQRKRRGGTFLKVVLGVVIGGTVLIAGCGAIIGAGLNAKETSGITRAEFDSISQGTAQSAIEDRYGKPEDSQQFEQQIPELQSQPSTSSCIYYAEKGKEILDGQSFQLCFDEANLTSKNAY
jgi:hypothetical protein